MSSILQTPELAVGIAVGGAAGAAFDPKIEVPKQKAWAANPVQLPDIGLIAALVAGGKITQTSGYNMANRLGYSNGTLDSITWLAQNRLDFPVMLRMWRLAAVNPAFDDAGLSALLDETLAHEQLDWGYRQYLRALKTAELPGIGDIAYGIVRGILPAPSWVPVAPPTTTTKVKRFPVVEIDPVQLAAAQGYDEDMLRLLVGRSGLSIAPGLAAQAYFRGLLADDDYLLAIAEGDLRTEWAEVLREATRQIPTVGEMMEHSLRGFESVASAKTNAQRHGSADADAQLVYDNLGRAPAAHAVTTGLARGGTYDGTPKSIPEPYLSAVRRANIRPEWYDLEYANRYTYPTGFQVKAETIAGDVPQPEAEQLLLEMGWVPKWATFFSTAWAAKAGGTATDPHVKKAQTTLFTEAHKAYVKTGLTQAQVMPALNALTVPAPAQAEVFKLWDAEKQLASETPPA